MWPPELLMLHLDDHYSDGWREVRQSIYILSFRSQLCLIWTWRDCVHHLTSPKDRTRRFSADAAQALTSKMGRSEETAGKDQQQTWSHICTHALARQIIIRTGLTEHSVEYGCWWLLVIYLSLVRLWSMLSCRSKESWQLCRKQHDLIYDWQRFDKNMSKIWMNGTYHFCIGSIISNV